MIDERVFWVFDKLNMAFTKNMQRRCMFFLSDAFYSVNIHMFFSKKALFVCVGSAQRDRKSTRLNSSH